MSFWEDRQKIRLKFCPTFEPLINDRILGHVLDWPSHIRVNEHHTTVYGRATVKHFLMERIKHVPAVPNDSILSVYLATGNLTFSEMNTKVSCHFWWAVFTSTMSRFFPPSNQIEADSGELTFRQPSPCSPLTWHCKTNTACKSVSSETALWLVKE